MSKKTVLTIIVLIIIAFGLYQGFLRRENQSFVTEKVIRGDIVQSVSETGQIKKGEKIDLNFKNAGRIEKIYVKVGDKVKESSVLAKLDVSSLNIQLEEAKAARDIAQAKLQKLLAGATAEEIKAAKTAVANAQTSLEGARLTLEDTENSCQENLKAAYENALNVLDAASLESEKSLNLVGTLFRTYFIPGDRAWVTMKDNKDKIESALDEMKPLIEKAKAEPEDENISLVLTGAEDGLRKIQEALASAREAAEDPNYRNTISSADKTSLDVQRTNINTALTNVINSQQSIDSVKLANKASIDIAENNVSAAEGNVAAAQDKLAEILAKPRQEDINLYQAQIRQSNARISLLEKQIEDAFLKSPTSGQITEVNKKAGEMVQPIMAKPVISLIPNSLFQIKADIYEEEVIKVKVGDPVKISIAAIPNQVFQGKVISVNPAEKLIEGVVYYETTIGFEGEMPKGIKPGMTVDISIETASRKNVLVIPEDALIKKDGRMMVRILDNGSVKEREIKLGLRSSDNIVEVISGLQEGEKVIMSRK